MLDSTRYVSLFLMSNIINLQFIHIFYRGNCNYDKQMQLPGTTPAKRADVEVEVPEPTKDENGKGNKFLIA